MMMAMANAVPGREKEFEDWYSSRHVHEMMQAPGIVSAQCFVLTDLQRYKGTQPFRYMALYEIEGEEVRATIDYLISHAGTAISGCAAMASEPQIRELFFYPITPRRTKPLPDDGTEPEIRNVLAAMTNAVDGREDEFNDWYTNRHLPDVVKAPDILAAQRFVLDDQQRYAGPYFFKYLAIYEITADSVGGVIDYISQFLGTPAMPSSDALSVKEPRARGAYFRPLTHRFKR